MGKQTLRFTPNNSFFVSPIFVLASLLLLIVVILFLTNNEKFMPSFEKKQNDKDYNIIIISATNIGTNHLGTYGYERSTSPNIDALAEESIVFDNFFAPASWTLPTGTSLFTSLYPYRHGVMERLIDAERIPSARLNADTNTLIDILKDNGYITAAFTGGFDYRPFFGLTNRFDSYTFSTGKISSKNPNMKFMENARFGHMVDVIPKALDWIKQNKRKKKYSNQSHTQEPSLMTWLIRLRMLKTQTTSTGLHPTTSRRSSTPTRPA